jgi:hypothetical protein
MSLLKKAQAKVPRRKEIKVVCVFRVCSSPFFYELNNRSLSPWLI